jgi:hypothetical protein
VSHLVRTIYVGLHREAVEARAAGLGRFAAWERRHPPTPSAEVALAGVAMMYELLPAASRVRPIDTGGVTALHRALSVLSRARG